MVKVYVEGGGDSNALRTACRAGFAEFLKKTGLIGKMPRIVACGSRKDAYDSYCIAIEKGEDALLLVDSEAAVNAIAQNPPNDPLKWQPWIHLDEREGDKWPRPDIATDLQCHLMVECMESWFLADRNALKSFFGNGFKENQLPPETNAIENITKNEIFQSLTNATSECKTKAKYGKGEHSFKLLSKIDPNKIITASPWAKRFVCELKRKMNV
ncbi:DUF4276 family protein [Sediminibacterium sp.]|uniref:DUF4276 family protein n=1 Tax=Sediminibacterium sp. TaxID=1917865 RepID=UPI003F69C777